MSTPLKDFRGKITAETDCVLDAIARVSGKDRAEIARDVLHSWASERLEEHSILHRLLRAEGLAGAYEGAGGIGGGTSGNSRERRGVSRA